METQSGDDPEERSEDGLVPKVYVQPDLRGGTILANREPHPNAGMEAKFQEGEGVGFRIDQIVTSEWGTYYRFEDACDPPHLGTVNENEVYVISVERILRRCPKWKAWKADQERREGT